MRLSRSQHDSMRLRAVVLTGGAAMAAVWFSARHTTSSTREASLPPSMSPVSEERPSYLAWVEKARTASTTRDPFSSPVFDGPQSSKKTAPEKSAAERIQVEASGHLTVRAVMLGSSRAAMINGQVSREGDSVAGFVLKRIDAEGITVEKDGVEARLEVR